MLIDGQTSHNVNKFYVYPAHKMSIAGEKLHSWTLVTPVADNEALTLPNYRHFSREP